MMTGKEFLDGGSTSYEVGESRAILVEDPISSPLGSFQSLHNSQSSEKEKMIPYVPPSEEIRVLQFEDTLSEIDRRSFITVRGKSRKFDLT